MKKWYFISLLFFTFFCIYGCSHLDSTDQTETVGSLISTAVSAASTATAESVTSESLAVQYSQQMLKREEISLFSEIPEHMNVVGMTDTHLYLTAKGGEGIVVYYSFSRTGDLTMLCEFDLEKYELIYRYSTVNGMVLGGLSSTAASCELFFLEPNEVLTLSLENPASVPYVLPAEDGYIINHWSYGYGALLYYHMSGQYTELLQTYEFYGQGKGYYGELLNAPVVYGDMLFYQMCHFNGEAPEELQNVDLIAYSLTENKIIRKHPLSGLFTEMAVTNSLFLGYPADFQNQDGTEILRGMTLYQYTDNGLSDPILDLEIELQNFTSRNLAHSYPASDTKIYFCDYVNELSCLDAAAGVLYQAVKLKNEYVFLADASGLWTFDGDTRKIYRYSCP